MEHRYQILCSATLILSNDPDHAGAQIAAVSKNTYTYSSDK